MAKDSALNKLAKLYGVQTSYVDMRNLRIHAPEESIRLALHALGALHSPDSDLADALRISEKEITARAFEPVMVAWNGDLRRHTKRFPKNATLILEDGATADWTAGNRLPHGYHRLLTQEHGRTNESLVISAPVRAHFPLAKSAWGIFAPVYGLHSKRSYGAGDLTDLGSISDWMEGQGGKVLSTLPLLANYLDTPFEPSPYSPISKLFWNEFYVDPTRVPEFATSRAAQRLAVSTPGKTKYVDYLGVMAAKRAILEALTKSFFSNKGDRRHEEFSRFADSNSEAVHYARFRAVTDRQQRGWRVWPERLRGGITNEGDFDKNVYRYHLYVQWIVQDQLRHLTTRTRNSGTVLYLDLPLGLHIDSYDTWRYPEFFLKGMSGGAPPDPVFTTGQNWSFPPMHPQAMRRNKYQYTIATIRNHLQYAPLLRIDHVMGLHRLYCIPEGLPGEKGLYVSYPAEEMYAILSLESHRYRAGIVGENLGVVPAEVNRSLARHNIRPLFVVQFETAVGSGQNVLRKPPQGSVASLNTHDMFPFRAFLEGSDIADRADLKFLKKKEATKERKERRVVRKALGDYVGGGNSSPKKVFSGCVEFLARSEASVVLVNLEDLWQETEPQNIPATTMERPNWRRRMRYSIERLGKARDIRVLLENLNLSRGKVAKSE